MSAGQYIRRAAGYFIKLVVLVGLLYLLMFPVFIFTYIPMAVVALRKNVTWKSIPHSILCTPDQICGKK